MGSGSVESMSGVMQGTPPGRMELTKGFIGEEFPTLVQIEENGVKYEVDIRDGQKTGFFLDQKYNRLAIQKLCKGRRFWTALHIPALLP